MSPLLALPTPTASLLTSDIYKVTVQVQLESAQEKKVPNRKKEERDPTREARPRNISKQPSIIPCRRSSGFVVS